MSNIAKITFGKWGSVCIDTFENAKVYYDKDYVCIKTDDISHTPLAIYTRENIIKVEIIEVN